MEQSWLEYEYNIQRQLLLFNEVVKHLTSIGFSLENKGVLDIHLHYLDAVHEVTVEMDEQDGTMAVDVYEYNLVTKLHSSTSWVMLTAEYNADEMIQRLQNSFHFSKLR